MFVALPQELEDSSDVEPMRQLVVEPIHVIRQQQRFDNISTTLFQQVVRQHFDDIVSTSGSTTFRRRSNSTSTRTVRQQHFDKRFSTSACRQERSESGSTREFRQ